MKCRVCGGTMEPRVTDLPFKIAEQSIVIVKALPVLQCNQCGDTEMEDSVMAHVDELLARMDSSAELEAVRFAA
ncbi:MAG: YgiT-type zinc finger protein [Acidobacteria bacterium]|nr:YgiT-type zinc finger protein [Acidobacteriota bacterium]